MTRIELLCEFGHMMDSVSRTEAETRHVGTASTDLSGRGEQSQTDTISTKCGTLLYWCASSSLNRDLPCALFDILS
eukprot:806259-Amphidinium_carterae.3